jgi:hypothetical protein
MQLQVIKHRRTRIAFPALLGMGELFSRGRYWLAHPDSGERALEFAHAGHSYWEVA